MNTNKFPWINGGTIEIYVNDGLTILREYDAKDNQIHFKDSTEYELWSEYDAKGNLIHYKDLSGFEVWKEFDVNGKIIHYKNSVGYESWHEYDSNGKIMNFRNSNGYEEWYDDNGGEISKEQFDRIHSSSHCEGKIIEVDGKKYKLIFA